MPDTITTTVTKVASPFSLEQLRDKADANIAARAASAIPYYVIMLKPTAGNIDTSAHVEPFDVDATNPDPANGIYGDDSAAKAAALARLIAVKSSMAPYCYVAMYSAHDDPPRVDDLWVPPAVQPIETHTTTRTKIGAVAAVAAVAVAGGLSVLAGRSVKTPRRHAQTKRGRR